MITELYLIEFNNLTRELYNSHHKKQGQIEAAKAIKNFGARLERDLKKHP